MMKTSGKTSLVILLAGLGLGGATFSQGAQKINARDLVRQVETQYLGKTSYAVARMRVVSEAWTRELVMEMWGEGRDKFLAKIQEPKKEKGIATLKIDDDIWNYLPKIDRLIKIPSSLMGDRWMGSHLTNDDLVKENKVDLLYDLSVQKSSGVYITILAVPKPDAPVVWGKILYDIDLPKRVPKTVRYYDEDGELVRLMTFGQIKRLGDRWVALEMRVQPVDEPKESTVILYEKLQYDLPLKGSYFSLRTLRKR